MHKQRPADSPQDFGIDPVTAANEVVLGKLGTSERGLSHEQVEKRLREFGPNEIAHKEKLSIPLQIFSKFFDPLIFVLVIIALFSYFIGHNEIQASIVIIIAVVSVILSFIQEHKAGKAAEKLSAMVHTKATVLRSGMPHKIEIKKIVPGDIVELSIGDMVPADLRIISSKDLFINQSALTGESFPVEKNNFPVVS